jgi:hypothetical protein
MLIYYDHDTGFLDKHSPMQAKFAMVEYELKIHLPTLQATFSPENSMFICILNFYTVIA